MNSLPHEPPLTSLSSAARAFLAAGQFPRGPFDPRGGWKQRWAIFVTAVHYQAGTLSLEKAPEADGAFTLQVDWKVQQSTHGFQRLRATVMCSADDLATPRSWQATSEILDPSEHPIARLTVSDQVTVKDGVLQTADGRRRFAGNPLQTWSSNWSLLEAIPRLGNQETKPLNFSLLDYLDERKDEQSLSFSGSFDLNLGGRQAHLRGYQQLGRGNLPMEYWLDEQNRLVILLGRERCLLATEI